MKIALFLVGTIVVLFGFGLIAFGIYASMVWMLVGGIVDIVNQIKAPVTQAGPIAWGIVKILFCEAPFICGIWGGILTVGVGVGITRLED